MKEVYVIVAALILVLITIFAFASYEYSENRKAYYTCLALSEKIAEQQKQPDGGVRIVSLPSCRI